MESSRRVVLMLILVAAAAGGVGLPRVVIAQGSSAWRALRADTLGDMLVVTERAGGRVRFVARLLAGDSVTVVTRSVASMDARRWLERVGGDAGRMQRMVSDRSAPLVLGNVMDRLGATAWVAFRVDGRPTSGVVQFRGAPQQARGTLVEAAAVQTFAERVGRSLAAADALALND